MAIPLPVNGPFSYRVPDEFTEKLQIGSRVFVPFRNKLRAGFIVGFPGPENQPQDMKDVLDVPDEEPYFTLELWEFIQWLANYYLLPTGLVLKTALPPGLDRRSKPWAIITEEGRQWIKRPACESEQEAPAKLLKSGAMLLNELSAVIGQEKVREWIQSDWITIEERIARPRTTLHKKNLRELLNPVGIVAFSTEEPLRLTNHQQAAVEHLQEAIREGGFKPFLLFGVTGSGKTEVYLRAIETSLAMGKRVLVLVPEIALTPQSARRFLRRFGGGVTLFHSGLTPAQRVDEWRRIRAARVNVVIATRSGIFLPMDNLGLIVVDEEHDPSYKQEDSCPYNARDMALARGKLNGACVILGSATPSFETFSNVKTGRIARIDLPGRYHAGPLPGVELVDLKLSKEKEKKRAFLTTVLVEAIGQALARQEQVALFLNRRGFDTFAQCRSCGHVFSCPNCDISLTHHKASRALRCHICGFSRSAPPICPQCSNTNIFFGGVGTQKVEEELVRIFPEARVERLDRDSTRRREDLEGILDRFRRKEIDILTGTQMITKGHDFPGISLVGVLCGDMSLHFPDFRASERTFQMLTQVAGRTGRGTNSGRVLIQTFDPGHEAIKFAASHAYEDFFEYESAFRRELRYPPFGYLILVKIEGNVEKKVEAIAVRIGRAARLLKGNSREVMILGPAPSPRRKAEGKFRWQVLFKAERREPLRDLVGSLLDQGQLKAHGIKIIVDVDPVDLM